MNIHWLNGQNGIDYIIIIYCICADEPRSGTVPFMVNDFGAYSFYERYAIGMTVTNEQEQGQLNLNQQKSK